MKKRRGPGKTKGGRRRTLVRDMAARKPERTTGGASTVAGKVTFGAPGGRQA
jgi:hypothetical protein